MEKTVSYADVRPGDRIWNAHGYTAPKGHWTRVTNTENTGLAVHLHTSDGYQQTGHPREGIAIQREPSEPLDQKDRTKAMQSEDEAREDRRNIVGGQVEP